MQFTKPFIAAAALAVVGAGTMGIGTTFAAARMDMHTPPDGLITALASHFHVNEDEVRSVFDEQRTAMEAAKETRANERLAALVADGTLTQEQADALTEKREATRTLMESLKDATMKERKDAMDAKRDELQTWADEEGLDLKDILPRPPHNRGHHGMMADDEPTQDETP